MWKKPVQNKTVTLSGRQKIIQAFTKVVTSENVDPTELEEIMFVAYKQYGIDYFEKAETLLWNITNNPSILARHTASSLFCSSNEELRNDETKLWYQQLEDEKQKQESFLAYVKNYNEGEKNANSIACGKCQSNDIATTQQQTRGADEAITTFFYCRKCAARWRM